MRKLFFVITLFILIILSTSALSEDLTLISSDQFSISLPSNYTITASNSEELTLSLLIPNDPWSMGRVSFIWTNEGLGTSSLFDPSTAINSYSSLFNLLISYTEGMTKNGVGISDIQIKSMDVTRINTIPVIAAKADFLVDYYTLGHNIDHRLYLYILIGAPSHTQTLTMICSSTDIEEYQKICNQYVPTLKLVTPEIYSENGSDLNLREILYQNAVSMLNNGQYFDAEIQFGMLSILNPYKDAAEKSLYCRKQQNNHQPTDEEMFFLEALNLYDNEQFIEAETYCRIIQALYASERAQSLRFQCLSALGIIDK